MTILPGTCPCLACPPALTSSAPSILKSRQRHDQTLRTRSLLAPWCARTLLPRVWKARSYGLWAQASENKKELFRKYLENAGVIDTLTKGARPRSCRFFGNINRSLP